MAKEGLAELLAAAAANPHEEICGLMFGSPDRIDRIAATANVAADRARTFEIDPAALFAALRAARQGGDRLIGHYHSHPSGSAVPSAADLAAAEPGKMWLILGGGIARLWLAQPGAFRELRLTLR